MTHHPNSTHFDTHALTTGDRSDSDELRLVGVGLVTPLGFSAWDTFASLLAGRSISDRSADEDMGPAHVHAPVDPVALVRRVGAAAQAHHTAFDPAVVLAEKAAREALGQAGSTGDQTPCFVGVSKGAVTALDDACRSMRPAAAGDWARPLIAHAEQAVTLGPAGYLCTSLAERLRTPAIHCTIAACASGLAALHRARQHLLHHANRGDRVLVVASEASLLPQYIHSYRRLGVLAPLTAAGYHGRPLNHERQGFMLAEMAAAVVLERTACDAPAKSDHLRLADTAEASEGYDLIRSAPGMPAFRRIAERMAARGPVTAVHPHATGTAEHDEAEVTILAACHPNAAAYAVKGAVGHGLGASGLASLVVACLCSRARRRPPMPWIDRPIDAPLNMNAQCVSLPRWNRQAIYAAGFGGAVAGALIESI